MTDDQTFVYVFRKFSWTERDVVDFYSRCRWVILNEIKLKRVEVTLYAAYAKYALPSLPLAEKFTNAVADYLVEGTSTVLVDCQSQSFPIMTDEQIKSLPPLQWLVANGHAYDAGRILLHNNTVRTTYLVIGLDDSSIASYVKLRWVRS